MKLINGYIRVSTSEQGDSKLGIEAQRASVIAYAQSNGLEINQWFIDIRSGKSVDRPELKRCIADCLGNDHTMVVAKSCRLSRDIADGFNLRKLGINILILDTNIDNTMEYGIRMLFNQNEREEISKRTKAALAVLKSQGVVLGKPENFNDAGRAMGRATISANAQNNDNNRQASALIAMLREQKLSYQSIADKLNSLGMHTSRGKNFNPIQVKRLNDRLIAA